jgi:hypothetical protein
MVAGTDPEMVEAIESVTDVRAAVEAELDANDHSPEPRAGRDRDGVGGEQVREQLEDLGYM